MKQTRKRERVLEEAEATLARRDVAAAVPRRRYSHPDASSHPRRRPSLNSRTKARATTDGESGASRKLSRGRGIQEVEGSRIAEEGGR